MPELNRIFTVLNAVITYIESKQILLIKMNKYSYCLEGQEIQVIESVDNRVKMNICSGGGDTKGFVFKCNTVEEAEELHHFLSTFSTSKVERDTVDCKHKDFTSDLYIKINKLYCSSFRCDDIPLNDIIRINGIEFVKKNYHKCLKSVNDGRIAILYRHRGYEDAFNIDYELIEVEKHIAVEMIKYLFAGVRETRAEKDCRMYKILRVGVIVVALVVSIVFLLLHH